MGELSGIVLEQRAKTAAPVEDSRLHRVDRAIDDAGDLRVRQIVEVRQDQDASLFRRQGLEAP